MGGAGGEPPRGKTGKHSDDKQWRGNGSGRLTADQQGRKERQDSVFSAGETIREENRRRQTGREVTGPRTSWESEPEDQKLLEKQDQESITPETRILRQQNTKLKLESSVFVFFLLFFQLFWALHSLTSDWTRLDINSWENWQLSWKISICNFILTTLEWWRKNVLILL